MTREEYIMPLTYHVTALQITIYFNREGDHDHNGLIFALTANVPVLKYLQALSERDSRPCEWEAHHAQALARADLLQLSIPALPDPDDPEDVRRARAEARQPHPLVRPLVLRTNAGRDVEVVLQNEVRNRWVGIHLVGDGYDVQDHDGSDVGRNSPSLAPPDGQWTYGWQCRHEGVFPFHDGGNYSGGEDGTNVHGLFGALVVEPVGAIWRDPVSGRRSLEDGCEVELDGLYLDVVPGGVEIPDETPEPATTLEDHCWAPPEAYADYAAEAHREFVIFFHDQPEFVPPHRAVPPDPCMHGGDGHEGGGGHGGGHEIPPLMPVSYRAEPMINREHSLFALINGGHDFQHRPVLNEEQHHSSWMFGDPATPVLRAYIGDPVRIRLVHAAVKETHVFHLHLYEWHAVPEDQQSARIDAISVSPQTAHTIEPVWGAGNRQQVAGDAIWHCHLYPHFHEGMWGMFRTFETLQRGPTSTALQSCDPVYCGRRIGRYPDGTPIERLLPLPGRPLPPRPTPTHPGYPLYIPGEMVQKSPIPPWPDRELEPGEEPFCGMRSLRAADMPADYDYRTTPTDLERNAFNCRPVPGEMFTRNPFRCQQAAQWAADSEFAWNGRREICREVVVDRQRIDYNGYGWHDRDGHLFHLADEGHPDTRTNPDGSPRIREPLFFRGLHGQILNLPLHNLTPPVIAGTEFDPPFPPCERRPWQGECALHVHMVKFDPICADGASVGWNYMTGPVIGKKMVYRWWLDQEFGSIFFHDHLFANYRQKHGLYGALIVEPKGAEFLDPFSNRPIVSGLQARIRLREPVGGRRWFREFCIGIGDFVPMWDRNGDPLNPPESPGGHGDQAVMGLNYRSDPIPERLRDRHGREVDPANWFSSLHPYHRDPFTTRFLTHEGDPVWFRMIQGSHEEQHSWQVHGMRWRRFRDSPDSPLGNQQTIGISEAFTFNSYEPYGPGDYLYKLSAADDLWLGCWGIVRAFPCRPPACAEPEERSLVPLPRARDEPPPTPLPVPPAPGKMRRFHVVVEARRLVYREPDLVDPFALVYRLVSHTPPGGRPETVPVPDRPEPLVLRCREGEWVQVTLQNCLPRHYDPLHERFMQPEPFAPAVPVEERNAFSHRPERPVSRRVSMHADLLAYDVRTSDGAFVGRNHANRRQRAKPGKSVVYTWHARGGDGGEPLGPVLLQDMADFRNHRHHGLVGALIVEDRLATPLRVEPGDPTADAGAPEAWHGARATLLVGKRRKRTEEAVLLLQDGLRHFLRGDVHFPIPDGPPGLGETETDAEDQGQKAFNYRSEPVGPNVDPNYDPRMDGPPGEWPAGDWLSDPNPATPVFTVAEGSRVRMHLVGACDKPRNHAFTVHGVAWKQWPYLHGAGPRVASESAITAGSVHTFEVTPEHTGDHAYRSGVLKWAVPEGLWGILRVVPRRRGGKKPRKPLPPWRD